MTHMNITQEQYDADIRAAKVQALHDAREDLFNRPDSNSEDWHEGYVCALERLLGLAFDANREAA